MIEKNIDKLLTQSAVLYSKSEFLYFVILPSVPKVKRNNLTQINEVNTSLGCFKPKKRKQQTNKQTNKQTG